MTLELRISGTFEGQPKHAYKLGAHSVAQYPTPTFACDPLSYAVVDPDGRPEQVSSSSTAAYRAILAPVSAPGL
jgi:hypothetical protein